MQTEPCGKERVGLIEDPLTSLYQRSENRAYSLRCKLRSCPTVKDSH